MNKLKPATINPSLQMARATRSQRLETRTREVILNNFLQLKNTRLFKQLTHRELISIIHMDDLVTPNEDVICGAVLSWVNADRPKRKFVLGEILRHVRLPQVRLFVFCAEEGSFFLFSFFLLSESLFTQVMLN